MRQPPVPYLEPVAAAVWWTVGAAALDVGTGTVVSAAGLAVTAVMAAAIRRRSGAGAPLPAGERGRLLRALGTTVALVVVAGVGLRFVGYAELTFPLACALVGVGLLLVSPVLDDRSVLAAGGALMVLGAAGAVLALGSAGALYPQGVVGLGAGALLWLAGAHRTGLLAEARGRVRR
jgi:hypothetical protein